MSTRFYFICIALIFAVSCNDKSVEQGEADDTAHLGILNHEFSISEEAAGDFEKGLLLLHSFEYDDALVAFQEASKRDSTEVMAYWGAALCHYKALWGLQDKRAGYEVMENLGITKEERVSKISDPLELDFWEGLEILYGDGTLEERNKAFNEHMGMLHKKYPSNQEAAAFYALSMMWENGEEMDLNEIGKRSAEIASGILAENPLHPGALHYTIHAYDNPEIADLAMDAANKYAKVAPDAAHALHMPSHIYLALGMWNDVTSSNEVSYQASVNRMERMELGDDARGYHSYAWLHYSYLQQGRVEDATKLLSAMEEYYEGTQSKSIRSYLISMQAAQLFETGNWADELNYIDVKKSDLGLYAQMNTFLLKGYLAKMNKDLGGINNVIDSLESEIRKADLYVAEDKQNMCSAGPTRYAPDKDAILKAKTVLNELFAFRSMVNNDGKEEEYMKTAVEFEKSSRYSFGPADITLPSFELYGEYLLNEKRFDEALEQFEISLQRAPNRRKALLGKKTVLKAKGDKEGVKAIEEILNEFSPEGSIAEL